MTKCVAVTRPRSSEREKAIGGQEAGQGRNGWRWICLPTNSVTGQRARLVEADLCRGCQAVTITAKHSDRLRAVGGPDQRQLREARPSGLASRGLRSLSFA